MPPDINITKLDAPVNVICPWCGHEPDTLESEPIDTIQAPALKANGWGDYQDILISQSRCGHCGDVFVYVDITIASECPDGCDFMATNGWTTEKHEIYRIDQGREPWIMTRQIGPKGVEFYPAIGGDPVEKDIEWIDVHHIGPVKLRVLLDKTIFQFGAEIAGKVLDTVHQVSKPDALNEGKTV